MKKPRNAKYYEYFATFQAAITTFITEAPTKHKAANSIHSWRSASKRSQKRKLKPREVSPISGNGFSHVVGVLASFSSIEGSGESSSQARVPPYSLPRTLPESAPGEPAEAETHQGPSYAHAPLKEGIASEPIDKLPKHDCRTQ